MPGSQIVPSLLAALYGAIIGSSTDETSLGVLYPTSIRACFAGEDDNFSDSDGSWAWHVVPAVNLFLALVVLLFLIEDRCVPDCHASSWAHCVPPRGTPVSGAQFKDASPVWR